MVLAFTAALKQEVSGIIKQMVIGEINVQNDWRIYKGKLRKKEILLVQSGLGKVKAEKAAEFVLKHYPVTAIISIGFGGALIRELKVGDIVLSSVLYCENENVKGENPCYSDTNLTFLATKVLNNKKFKFLQGKSVTAAKPVSEPRTKQALRKAFGAEVVDMESYWIALIALKRKVPFLNVRVILDTAADVLPPFSQFWDLGRWHLRRAAFYFLTQPKELTKLFYLYRNAQRCERSLTEFVDSFIAAK